MLAEFRLSRRPNFSGSERVAIQGSKMRRLTGVAHAAGAGDDMGLRVCPINGITDALYPHLRRRDGLGLCDCGYGRCRADAAI